MTQPPDLIGLIVGAVIGYWILRFVLFPIISIFELRRDKRRGRGDA